MIVLQASPEIKKKVFGFEAIAVKGDYPVDKSPCEDYTTDTVELCNA